MANVQLEDGSLHIADSLQAAIMRREFSALERRVLDGIMRFTYRAGKTRAEITPEDIRLMIEGERRVRTDRIEQVLVKLTKQNVITTQPWNNNKYLIGIQKDFDKWVNKLSDVDNLSSTLQEIYINTNNTSSIVADNLSTKGSADKATVPEKLVAYSQKRSGMTHSISTWRLERSYAIKVYKTALELTNDPKSALLAIRDYMDENEWMRLNVQRQFAYMNTRFEMWYRQIPRKPREVREDEEALGKRYRYNVSKKLWEVADDVSSRANNS